MSELLFFLVFYTVPFGALFILRRLTWLVAGGAIALAVIALLYAASMRSSGDAAIGAFILLFCVTAGFVSGGLGRLLLIGLSDRSRLRPFVGPAFYFGAPLLVAAISNFKDWKERRRYAPPSAECRSQLHEVHVGDAAFYLPLMDGFAVWRGARSGLFMFVPPEKARQFCEEAQRRTPQLTAITIDFWQLETRPQLQQRPPCDTPRRQAWWPLLCRFQKGKRMDIHQIGIFDPARFDAETMLSVQLASSEYANGIPTGKGWTRDPSGLWRNGNAGETWWQGYSPKHAASPWLARCVQQKSSIGPETIWRCHAGYRLTGGAAVGYGFEAGLDTFASDVVRIDGEVDAIVASLRQSDGAVSSAR